MDKLNKVKSYDFFNVFTLRFGARIFFVFFLRLLAAEFGSVAGGPRGPVVYLGLREAETRLCLAARSA